VQEALHVLTRKLKVIARAEDAELFMQHTLVPLWRVQPSPGLYAAALGIQQRQGFGFYDSLIVAAVLEAGCRRLLSEDLQHGQRIGKLRIENPFLGS
jgi:predicted nucleic acid-binding protein